MLGYILLSVSLVLSTFTLPTLAAFGVQESGNSFIVDTDGGLVFTVDKRNGDITSMLYKDKQAQDQSKRNHIGSGLGTAPCSWTRIGDCIKIACVTETLTQYYVAQSGTPAIHMATYITREPSVGELRFIGRLNAATLPNGPVASKIGGSSGVVEGKDVFLVGDQTRSKFYSSRQFIDDQVHGVTGSGIGAYMIIPGNGYESSSGGPFFRDIINQSGSIQEVYFYMNSGHTQTEANRMGLHGPYLLRFTDGETPSAKVNTDFWDGLDITGWVPNSKRGLVKGKASGVPAAYTSSVVVGWSNSEAQYWTRADASTGNYYPPATKPGAYIMTMYKGELAVANKTVTISVGTTGVANIKSTEPSPTTIWQIGEFDGTPHGFLNADLIETVHPSDNRMRDWLRTYTVGKQDISYFPMAAFRGVGPVTVRFSLESSQLGARTLEIGVTLAFAGGRPLIKVNDWSAPTPAAPSQPKSRGVTRGTWRGNNTRYTFRIPSGVLVSGSSNFLTVGVISGSGGDMYLSPNVVFDAVRLY